MTREQLNKANAIDDQIKTLETRRLKLAEMIKNAFSGSLPSFIGEEDEFKLLKELIYREIDITFNKKLRELEEQLTKI